MGVREECIELYKEAFGDDGELLEALFKNNFRDCRYIEIDGFVAAMFFLLPCKLSLKGKEQEALYLYAAATERDHRKQGLMSGLLESVFESTQKPIFLKAATSSLSKFYEKRGFATVTAIRTNKGENVLKPKFTVPPGERRSDESLYELMYYSKTPISIDKIAFDCPMD